MGINEDDFVEYLIFMLIYDMIFFFLNKGKVYCVKGYEIFEYGRIVKGILIINLLEVEKGEWINVIILVIEFNVEFYFFFIIKYGVLKWILLF